MKLEKIILDSPVSNITKQPSSVYNNTSPLHIGVVVCGDWKSSTIALEYLILYLNQKQSLFEYQLVSSDELLFEMKKIYGVGSSEDKLLNSILAGSEISQGKLEMKHILNNISTTLIQVLNRKYDAFDSSQCPSYIIYISTSKHTDPSYFQDDGSNGFSAQNPCRGAIIMTGHHDRKLAPPTVVEFVFKFIFRISLKFKFPEFKRNKRHYGQKSCLFDCCHDMSRVRYMILHNYICQPCRSSLSASTCNEILKSLDASNIYGNEIARHPAKISSDLGFNLSLVKGLYKSNYELAMENLSNSFLNRLGSLAAITFGVSLLYMFELDFWFVNED
tara:strand:+ start:1957 stop:2952 length:996 start_codon:yes stop_codon:yes gene_type:complete